MSKEAVKWYGEQKLADATLKNLLYVLAYEAKKGTGDCASSQAVLAQKTGMTDRSVRANLVILAQLEMITRKVRNKGRYGRTTDLITLSLGRTFDISRPTIRALRKSLKKHLPPEPASGGAKISHRKHIPLPPEAGSREYYRVNQEESLSVGIPYNGREGTYTREEGATDPRRADRDKPDSNVIPFRPRGAR